MRKLVWIVAVLAGCSNKDAPSSSIDASSNPGMQMDGPDVTKTAITVVMTDPPPLYIGYSDGDAGWVQLDPLAQNVSFEVRDRYRFIAVCDDGGLFETAITARAVADGTSVTPGCVGIPPGDTEPDTVDVSATVTQPGRLSVGPTSRTGNTPNWTFSETIGKGVHEVLATSTDHKVSAQKIDFEANTTLPTIDLTGATALRAIALTATNVPADATPSTSVYVRTNIDVLNRLDTDPSATGYVLPDGFTADVTAQNISLAYIGGSSDQLAFQRVDANLVTEIEMLSPLLDTTFTKGTATWKTPLPDGDATLESFDDENFNYLHMTASAAYLAHLFVLTMSTDDVPGFKPEWVTATDANLLDLGVDRMTGPIDLTTVAFPSVAFAPRALVSRARARERHAMPSHHR